MNEKLHGTLRGVEPGLNAEEGTALIPGLEQVAV